MEQNYTDLFSEMTLIGKGSLSKVYRIILNSNNLEYAAKEIQTSKTNQNKETIREKEALSVLSEIDNNRFPTYYGHYHNIMKNCRMYDYILIGLIKGITLEHYFICKAPKVVSVEEFKSISIWFIETLKILKDQKIIHRDIKPSNVMVENHSNRLILIDFGYSEFMDTGKILSSRGTPNFTPKEIWNGDYIHKPELLYNCDLYSAIVSLYWIVENCLPYKARDKCELEHNINSRNIRMPQHSNTKIRKLLAYYLTDGYIQNGAIDMLLSEIKDL